MLRQAFGDGRLSQAKTPERKALEISAPVSSQAFDPSLNDEVSLVETFTQRLTAFVRQELPVDAIAITEFLINAPPGISTLSHTVGDTAGGGQNVVITGTSMASVTSVTFGGTAATIIGKTDTTVTVQIPARTAGVVNVAVTNPHGTTTASNAFEYWAPTQLASVVYVLDADKGVTTAGTSVTAWDDQSSNGWDFTAMSESARPQRATNVFGSLPGILFGQDDWLQSGSGDFFTWSVFAVVKWSSSDTTAAGTSTVPLNIIGISGQGSFGASGGAIAWRDDSPTSLTRGSGLNDGSARMIGATQDADTIKFYAGATQQGTDGVVGNNLFNLSYLGNLEDGFDGHVAAVVCTENVISGGDLTKLHNWAKQRWGAA